MFGLGELVSHISICSHTQTESRQYGFSSVAALKSRPKDFSFQQRKRKVSWADRA